MLRPGRRPFVPLGGLLLLGLVLRVAYLVAQPATDPRFALPMLDGEYYMDWAQDLATGAGSLTGAYYLAPLFPLLLAPFVVVFGRNFFLLYLAQHLLTLATAGVLGGLAWRKFGRAAGLAATTLFLFHQPFVFFASCPLAEPLGLLFLVLALGRAEGQAATSACFAGALAGLAALARPNLLLVPALWVCGESLSGRWRRAGFMLLGLALPILPVTLRNYAASGHLVLVSANVGITAYHGNGPGARGTFTLPAGFSGVLRHQREEATALARSRSGLDLDPVEADLWWGRQAIRTRLADPWASARLLGRRCLLLVDDFEHGLDYSPTLDANPWRLTIRLGGTRASPGLPIGRQVLLVPFALVLGLSMSALVLGGVGGSGGWRLWAAVLACAATPLVFFVSSRYRLPLVALLVLPAGRGLVGLLGLGESRPARRRAIGAAIGLACAACSIAVPSQELRRIESAGNLSNRAAAFKRIGDRASAEKDARMATLLDPRSATAHFNLGVILLVAGRGNEAEAAFREGLHWDPGLAEAATNLAALLIERGAADEAIPILRRALLSRPSHQPCWTQLVVALALHGDMPAVADATADARRAGVTLDPALLEQLQDTGQRAR